MQTFKWFSAKKSNNGLWLAAIVFLAAALRIWLCTEDNYLHEWDERYHALVAKNLLLHPLKPTLYETPLINYDFQEWAKGHIWLSKPPLALWCMALSFKCWGFTEWAVRFPSILFSLGSVLLTYKIGKQLFDQKIALWAAFFHAIHGMTLEVVAGRYSSDHVETMFLFWTELGVWAMVQYFSYPHNRKYAFTLGLITGMAFMCKWTAALLIPAIWEVIAVFMGKKVFYRSLFDSFLVLLGLLLGTAPWIIYISVQFPQEALYMLEGIITPLKMVVQDHAGAWYFYLNEARVMFGELIYLPMLWLLWISFRAYKSDSAQRCSLLILLCWIMVPLLILSMAATKRSNYLLMAAPAFYMLTALFMRFILQKYQHLNASGVLIRLVWLAFLILPIRYAIERSKVFSDRESTPVWAQNLKALARDKGNDPAKTLIFNDPHYVEAMFYAGYTAYSWIPITKVAALKAAGWRIFEQKDGLYLPW